MGIFKKIFHFLCCCFPSDPSYDLLERAQNAEKKFNESSDKGGAEAQEELKIAIDSYTSLVLLAETHKTNSVDLRKVLTNLASLTWSSYQFAIGQAATDILRQVIELNDKALNLPQDGKIDPVVMGTLSMNAATAYRERFYKKQDDSEAIAKSIQLFKDALRYFNEDSPDGTGTEITVEIGITYCTWFNRLTSVSEWKEEQVNTALLAIEKAYNACARDRQYLPDRTTCAHTLATIYSDRVREIDQHASSLPPLSTPPPSLNDAIKFFSLALETMPENDSRYPGELRASAEWLFYRFDRYSNAERDLSQSKDAASKALNYPDALTKDAVESLNFIINFDPTRTSRRDSRRERNTLRSFTIGHSRADSVDTAEEHRPPPMSGGDMTEEPLGLGDEDAA